MTEMGWATAAYGDAGVTEMSCVTGRIYSGDRVDRLHLVSSQLTSSYHTTNYTLYLSHLLISLALSDISCVKNRDDRNLVLVDWRITMR